MIDILLCDPDGAPKEKALQLLFQCMLPKLIAVSVDSKNANVRTKLFNTCYTHTMTKTIVYIDETIRLGGTNS